MPKSNVAYWQPKIARNVRRDAENLRKLADFGWEVATVWECEINRDPDGLLERLTSFLG